MKKSTLGYKIICFLLVFTILFQNLLYVKAEDNRNTVYIEKDYLWPKLTIGQFFSGIINGSGQACVAGWRELGWVGDGNTDGQEGYVPIVEEAKSITAGSTHRGILKKDNTLWAWGDNYSGQVGNGTNENVNTPVQILDQVNIARFSSSSSYAILLDGSLWDWGNNMYGQLGDGTTVSKNTPQKIMEDVVYADITVAMGAAIQSDGSLWMWGSGCNGTQLVEGYEASFRPVKVMEDVKFVSLTQDVTAVIKTDGSLWMWGKNTRGQLGNGSQEDTATPTKVLDNVKYVNLGWDVSCAIDEDNSLWVWGANSYGNIGDGTEEDSSVPIQIMDNVVYALAGQAFIAAVRYDRSLWAWGDDFVSFPFQIKCSSPSQFLEENSIERQLNTREEFEDQYPSGSVDKNTLFIDYPLYLKSADFYESQMEDWIIKAYDNTKGTTFWQALKYCLDQGGLEVGIKAFWGTQGYGDSVYNEFLDTATMKFLSEVSKQETATADMIKGMKDELSSFKKVFDNGEKLGKSELARCIKESVKGITQSGSEEMANELLEEWGNFNKFASSLGKHLDLIEYCVTFTGMLQYDMHLVEKIKEYVPKNTIIAEGLGRIDRTIKMNPARYLLRNYLNDRFFSAFVNDSETLFADYVLKKPMSPSSDLLMAAAKMFIKATVKVADIYIADADSVTNAIFQITYMASMKNSVRNSLIIQFANYKREGIYPEDIEREIEVYKLMFEAYLTSVRTAISAVDKVTNDMGKRYLKYAEMYLKDYTYEKYLQICIRAVQAENEGTGLKYSVDDDDSAVVVGYASHRFRTFVGTDSGIYIPSEIQGHAVEGIAPFAFKGNAEIESVFLAPGTQYIGEEAFAECPNLNYVYIPDTVSVIEQGAFRDCSNLQTVMLGNNLERLETNAFNGDSELKVIELPASVFEIGDNSFQDCLSLCDLFIYSSNLTLGNDAFKNVPVISITGIEGSPVEVMSQEMGAEFISSEKPVKEIYIEQMPLKMSYKLDEKANTEGMSLKVIYEDGTESNIQDGWEAGFMSQELDKGTIWIAYNEAVLTYDVNMDVTEVPYETRYVTEQGFYIQPAQAKLGSVGSIVTEQALEIDGYEVTEKEKTLELNGLKKSIDFVYKEVNEDDSKNSGEDENKGDNNQKPEGDGNKEENQKPEGDGNKEENQKPEGDENKNANNQKPGENGSDGEQNSDTGNSGAGTNNGEINNSIKDDNNNGKGDKLDNPNSLEADEVHLESDLNKKVVQTGDSGLDNLYLILLLTMGIVILTSVKIRNKMR